jgi:Tfp pilus assembly protein PilN
MGQQVNLYQPILGAEKRLFSARAIGAALTILIVCMGGLTAFGFWRTHRIERSVDQLERQEAANLALIERSSTALRPRLTLPQLDAEARSLSADIDARERALEIIRLGSVAPATGFAARLEALARGHLDGIWLSTIIVGSGEGRLAMRGATTDPDLLPAYLAALAQEPALDGVRFDKLAMRRADPGEAPAQMIFELDAPGLKLAALERGK